MEINNSQVTIQPYVSFNLAVHICPAYLMQPDGHVLGITL